MSKATYSVAFLGATGAVGTQVLQTLLTMPEITRVTLFGRREAPDLDPARVTQHWVDIFQPDTYGDHLDGHDAAICTLGVGEPSKVSREEFIKIDKTAVLDFARACRAAGVEHFELLASVGINAGSRNFYLRSKGELVEELKTLNFPRLSIFQPSMILTPTNRYGLSQGILLKIWPLLHPLLLGGLKKYRGVRVADLGRAMALNIRTDEPGMVAYLTWGDFQNLA